MVPNFGRDSALDKATTKLKRAQARIRELGKVIQRIGEITSEEWGETDTIYEEELNHLIMKKTVKEFKY